MKHVTLTDAEYDLLLSSLPATKFGYGQQSSEPDERVSLRTKIIMQNSTDLEHRITSTLISLFVSASFANPTLLRQHFDRQCLVKDKLPGFGAGFERLHKLFHPQ